MSESNEPPVMAEAIAAEAVRTLKIRMWNPYGERKSPQPVATDLVERLRQRAGQYDEYDWHGAIELEAAAEIERLRKEINGRRIE